MAKAHVDVGSREKRRCFRNTCRQVADGRIKLVLCREKGWSGPQEDYDDLVDVEELLSCEREANEFAIAE